MSDRSTVSLTTIVDRLDRSCIDVDARVFHPRKLSEAAVEFAKQICRSCPVITPCRAYATAHDLDGIWAATTHQERRELMQGRTPGRAPALTRGPAPEPPNGSE